MSWRMLRCSALLQRGPLGDEMVQTSECRGFVRLHQNNHSEMVIWKLQVATVQGSCRSEAIQILDSTNTFVCVCVYVCWITVDTNPCTEQATRMSLQLSQDLPSLCTSAVSTFTELPLAEGLSVPNPQLCGDRLPQERQAELFLSAGDQ